MLRSVGSSDAIGIKSANTADGPSIRMVRSYACLGVTADRTSPPTLVAYHHTSAKRSPLSGRRYS